MRQRRGWLSAAVPHPRAEEQPHHLPNPTCSPKTTPKKHRGCREPGSTLPRAAGRGPGVLAQCSPTPPRALPSPPRTSPAAAASSRSVLSKHGVCTGKTSAQPLPCAAPAVWRGLTLPVQDAKAFAAVFSAGSSSHSTSSAGAMPPHQHRNQTGNKLVRSLTEHPEQLPISPLGSDGHRKPQRSRNAMLPPAPTEHSWLYGFSFF